MAYTPINEIIPYVQQVAAEGATDFSGNWWISRSDDVSVYKDGMLLTTGYTISGLQEPAGFTVTFDAPMVGGEVITLAGDFDIQRLTGYLSGGSFRANSLNLELSTMTAIMLQLQRNIDRKLGLAITSSVNPYNLILPTPEDGRVLAWNGGLGAMQNGPSVTDILNVQDAAEQALESAIRAETAASTMEQKNNYSAITDPTVNDDSGDGYGVGSKWINTLTKAQFACVDTTVGAAVWLRILDLGVYGGCVVFLEDMPTFVGNGTSDDSAALIAAVAALPTRGGTVVLPGKRIGYNNPIPDNGKPVRFVGQGCGDSITKGATVLSPLSDVDGFRFTASRSEITDVIFDAQALCGTTPLSYTGTKNSRCVTIGYGFANAAYCAIKRVRFEHVPGLAIYWQEGSHLLLDQVVGFCCHGGGFDSDTSGYDNNHGNFQDVHFTYCRGQSFRSRTAYNIYKQLKFFGNETAPKLTGSSGVGNVFVEQHANARGNVNLVNGSPTLSSVSDYVLINTYVGAVMTGTGVPANTRVTAVDKTAKTITLNQNMTTTATVAANFVAPFTEQQCVLEVGRNCDGIIVIGDDVDPARVTMNGSWAGYSRSTTQNDFAITREGRFGSLRLRPPPNAGANSTANSIGDVFLGTFTSGSATIADVPAATFGRVRVGQTISGVLIPSSTTISAVDKTAGTITMSANATGSGSNYASSGGGLFGGKREQVYDYNKIVELSDFTINSIQKWFGGSGSIYRGYLTSGGANVELLVRAEANVNETIGTGWLVFSPYVPWGTTVTDVTNLASGTITMSANATATVSNEPIIFIRPSTPMLLGIIGGLPVYASDAAASSLTKGTLYQTSTGEVRIKL